jgi:hypothetical protein
MRKVARSLGVAARMPVAVDMGWLVLGDVSWQQADFCDEHSVTGVVCHSFVGDSCSIMFVFLRC